MFVSLVRRTSMGLLPVLLVACASSGPEEREQSERPIERLYTVAYISKISTALIADDQPDDKRVADKKTLDRKLPAIVNEAFEDNGFSMPSGPIENGAGVILIQVNVQYDPGNRALRWLAGPLGAGKATIEGRIEAVDALTGTVVATKSSTDTVRIGILGGDFYEEVEEFVEDLASDLSEELAEKSK